MYWTPPRQTIWGPLLAAERRPVRRPARVTEWLLKMTSEASPEAWKKTKNSMGDVFVFIEAIATRLEAIATRVEACDGGHHHWGGGQRY